MRKSSKIALYISSFLALNFLCKYLTDDFSTRFLFPPADPDSEWATDKTPENLGTLLKQKYSYLSKGKQSYVFLSEDGEHVLKLFKPLAPFLGVPLFGKNFHVGLSKVPFVNLFLIHKDSPSYQKTRDLEFRSYLNSFSLLPEETKIEYLHLARTAHLQTELKIYDKIGIERTLDLDSTSFLIQRKTDLLYPTLAHLLQNKETDKAKLLLKNFVEFYFHLIEKEIVNPTTLEKNLGCLDLKPIQIDVGRILRPQDIQLSTAVPLTQIHLSTSHMKKWLKTRSPELLIYLKQVEEELLEAKTTH